MIEAARIEFTPRSPWMIGRKFQHGETLFEFRMPIVPGFLEFVRAVALSCAQCVIDIAPGSLQGCGYARNFFRIESAKIVNQDILRPSVTDDMVRGENNRRAIGPKQNHLASK